MIKLRVTNVSKKTSCIQRTHHYTYPRGKCKDRESLGAVYESVEIGYIEEDKPKLKVANVTGNFFSEGLNLMINDPKLFGTFKAGDIVELRVVKSTRRKRAIK